MSTRSMLLASNNRHKRDEIRRALGGPPGRVVCPDELATVTGPPPDPVEDGDTYLANAIIKARAFSAWSGLPALADDSGLEVDALGGRPGLYSARYAGENATFTDNCRKMLEELADVPPEKRHARFICVIALCRGDELVFHTEGVCPGTIALEPRGEHGFGYDPIFIPDGASRTFAEMEPQAKDAISHRGRALEGLHAAARDGRLFAENRTAQDPTAQDPTT